MSYARLRELYDRVCGLDRAARASVLEAEAVEPSLRAELEALLETEAGTADAIAAVVDRAARDAMAQAGPERIGPWRVLGVLGEGGMGTVLLAERADGEFEMKVAIKLIRGHATPQARERFRRERQLLAALDHPNIAALIDGGTTDTGEPYLVMPYVEGETLSAWLARTQPRLETRLALFATLCRAVAHAHRHLIVHRDLKPSNLLVRHDGVPVLLDFGIAKLVEAETGEGATASRVMTPAWASPEQLLGRPVTTATDVYGLGLVLYELIAGGVPARGDAMRAASVELPAPSRLVATAASPLARNEARRLRGDLDKIARRAVRTDPTARYPSALALAQDVEAWLEGRPVAAAGTHASYVFARFVQRHRFASAAVAAALAASIAFAVGLARERDRARLAQTRATREAAVANETTRFLEELFSELDPDRHPGRTLSARELLDHGRDRIARLSGDSAAVRRRLQRSLGGIYANIGEPAPAIALLEAARDAPDIDAPALERARADAALGRSYYLLKRFDEAYTAAARAVAQVEAATPRDDAALGRALMTRGVAEQSLTRFDDAEASFERAQSLFEAAGDAVELASVLHNRGWLAEQRGDPQAALALYDRAYARKLALLGPEHPKSLASLHGRGKSLTALGRHEEAVAARRELLERTLRVHGEPSLPLQNALSDLGSALQDAGRYEEAQRHYERALQLASANDAGNGANVATVLNNLATLLEERGDFATAEAHYRRSRELRAAVLPEGHPSRGVPTHNLARLLLAAGRLDEARAMAEEAHALRAAALPAAHPLTLATAVVLAQIALAQGDEAGARAWLAPAEAAFAANPGLSPNLRSALYDTRARLAQHYGRPAERATALRESLDAAAAMFAAGHPRRGERQLALAEALLDAGDRAGAQALYAESSPVLRAQLVPGAVVLERLAALERALSR